MTRLPATAADFQTEWYYALVIFAVLVVTVMGFVLALRPVRSMWRDGAHGLASVVSAACAVTGALFLAMFLQVVIALAPGAFGGH